MTATPATVTVAGETMLTTFVADPAGMTTQQTVDFWLMLYRRCDSARLHICRANIIATIGHAKVPASFRAAQGLALACVEAVLRERGEFR